MILCAPIADDGGLEVETLERADQHLRNNGGGLWGRTAPHSETTMAVFAGARAHAAEAAFHWGEAKLTRLMSE